MRHSAEAVLSIELRGFGTRGNKPPTVVEPQAHELLCRLLMMLAAAADGASCDRQSAALHQVVVCSFKLVMSMCISCIMHSGLQHMQVQARAHLPMPNRTPPRSRDGPAPNPHRSRD